MELSLKQKRLVKWVGYPLLVLVTFVLTVFYTFPYERLKDRLEEQLSGKFDVEISSVRPTIRPGGVVLENIRLRTRPEKPDETPHVVFVDRAELRIGLLAGLFGRLSARVDADIGAGTVSGSVYYSKAGLEAEMDLAALPLTSIPGLAGAVGLPVAGGLSGEATLNLPLMKWSDAEGDVMLTCAGCTVGDGKATLEMKPRARPGRRLPQQTLFAGEGITVPRLSLGNVLIEIEVRNGVGLIKTLQASSEDGQLAIEGEIRFRDPVMESTFPACMKFKLSESLQKREPKFGSITNFMHPKLRQADGSYALPTVGTLAELRWDKQRSCGDAGEDEGERTRPTITSRPAAPAPVPATPPPAVEVEPPAVDDGDDEAGEADSVEPAAEEAAEPPEVADPAESGSTLSPARVRDMRKRMRDRAAGRYDEEDEYDEELDNEPMDDDLDEGYEDEEDEQPYVY